MNENRLCVLAFLSLMRLARAFTSLLIVGGVGDCTDGTEFWAKATLGTANTSKHEIKLNFDILPSNPII